MRALSMLLSLSALAATPALAGPPWISIEVRPGMPGIVVRTWHRGEVGTAAPVGTAEGLVAGRRVTVPLRFSRTFGGSGFDVARVWAEGGVHVLTIHHDIDHGRPGAVVGLDRNGEVAFIRYPRNADGTTRAATADEVSALLAALDSGAPAPRLARAGRLAWAARLLLLPMAMLFLLGYLVHSVWARRARARTALRPQEV